jgi:hypothetical protein
MIRSQSILKLARVCLQFLVEVNGSNMLKAPGSKESGDNYLDYESLRRALLSLVSCKNSLHADLS